MNLPKKIILILATLAGYAICFYLYVDATKNVKTEAEDSLTGAAEEASALVDNDSHAEMVSKGKIRREDYNRMLKPLVAFHMARPDLAHVYTVSQVGDEVYSILDTAPKIVDSNRHHFGYPGTGVEKINAPDPSLIKTLEDGVITIERDAPNRNTYGADIAIYTPIIRSNGHLAGAVAVTANRSIIEGKLHEVDMELAVRLATITAIAILIGLIGRGNSTELANARAAKDKLEEQFRTMTERLPGAVFIFSAKGTGRKEKGELLFASAGLRDMRGITPEKAAEDWKELKDVLPPDCQGSNEEKIAKAKRESRAWETEFPWNNKWIQLMAVPRKQEDKILWFGTLVDITTRKTEEEKLAATNELLRRISQTPSAKDTLQAICEFGAEGTQRTCIIHLMENGMLRAVAGTQTEEECAVALAHGRTPGRSAGAAAASTIGEEALHITSIQDSTFYSEADDLRKALLEAGYQSATAHPLYSEGKLLGVVEFLHAEHCPEEKPTQRDTQTAHLAGAALERINTIVVLQENEKRYHTLFEASPVGICEMDENNQIIFSNQAFVRDTNEETQLALAEASDERKEIRQGGKTLVAEAREIQKSNRQKHRVAFVYDISDQKVREEHAITSKEAAEAANQAKSEFLAVMSHEIRTPLNGVIGFAQMLEARPLGAKEKTFVGKIRQSGETLLATINDILNLSKIEAGKIDLESRSFNPTETLEICRDLVTPKAEEKQIDLILEAENLPPIIGDETRLRQIVMNLMGNAVKFTEKGEVRVQAKHENGNLTVKIVDTGIGISKENQTKLFRPFSQADQSTTRKFGGTGLGLVICKRLCELMGGKIELSSVLGKGTTFEFWLPAPIGEAVETRTSIDTGEDDPLQLSILVAEDDEINRLLIGEMLKGFGHEVEFAINGKAAVERAEELKDWAEVILMDMRMPEMDGLEATRAIRAKGITLPIVALTANAMEEDRERCLAAGMDNYLSKPIDVRALRRALRTYQTKKRAEDLTHKEIAVQETTAEESTKTTADSGEKPQVETTTPKENAGVAAWGFDLEPEITSEEAPILDREILAGCLRYIPKQTALTIFERMKKSCREGADTILNEEKPAKEKSGAAHKMVGAVGSLGCAALGALAKELELHYDQTDKPHPKEGDLKDLLEKTIKELENGLEELG